MGNLGGLIKGIAGFFTGNPALMAESAGEKQEDVDSPGLMPGIGKFAQGMSRKSKALQGYELPATQEVPEMQEQRFDLTNYLPQFKNGGVPNGGKPAIIYDMRSGKPTGTMNEEGAERIVPAYSGKNAYSIINDQPPQSTQNIGVVPDKIDMSNLIANMPSMTPSQSIVTGTPKDTIGQNKLNLVGKTGIDGETKGDKTSKKQTLADNSFLKTVKSISPILRIVGYAADARRRNLGMGAQKGMITSTLDWMESQEKKTTEPDYEGKLKMKQKYDIGTAKEKEKLKTKSKDYEKEAYDQLQEDIRAGNIVLSEDPIEAEQQKNEYLKDYLTYRKEGKRPKYKETIKEEPRLGGWLGTKKTKSMERAGYEQVSGNNEAQQALEWAQANPTDPRAKQILATLGV